MCEVKCPYKDKCRSYPDRCGTCRHNQANKRDYYEPEWPDYWWPYYPYPYWQTDKKTWDDTEPYVWITC